MKHSYTTYPINKEILMHALIFLYMCFLVLSRYDYLQQTMLLLSAVTSAIFIVPFLYDIRKTKKINITILLLILSIILSAIVNKQLLYPIGNIIFILATYYLINKWSKVTMKYLFFWIILTNFINFYIYGFMTPDAIGYKYIGSIEIQRISFKYLGFSGASIIAMFSFILADLNKNKLFKYIIKFTSLIIIFKAGKLSVIGSLLIIYLIYYTIYYTKNKYIIELYIVLAKLFVFLFFISTLILFLMDENLNSTLLRLITFRDIIWSDYYHELIKTGSFLYGNGFIPTDSTISFTNNTHSQYLMFIYVLGIFGSIAFLNLFFKVIEKSIRYSNRDNGVYLKLIVYIFMIMITDSFFMLSSNTIYLLIFVYVLLHYNNQKYKSRKLIRKGI